MLKSFLWVAGARSGFSSKKGRKSKEIHQLLVNLPPAPPSCFTVRLDCLASTWSLQQTDLGVVREEAHPGCTKVVQDWCIKVSPTWSIVWEKQPILRTLGYSTFSVCTATELTEAHANVLTIKFISSLQWCRRWQICSTLDFFGRFWDCLAATLVLQHRPEQSAAFSWDSMLSCSALVLLKLLEASSPES